MMKDNKQPESQPSHEADALSATGMFLSAMGTEGDAPDVDTNSELFGTPPIPSADHKPPGENSNGEFTRMFRSTDGAKIEPPAIPEKTLRQSTAAPPQAERRAQVSYAPSVAAPGEFTRVFVRPADRPPASAVQSIPEKPAPAPPNSVSGAPRVKGFSSGASDSASADGAFTQAFQPRSVAPSAVGRDRNQASLGAIGSSTSGEPGASPMDEVKWPKQTAPSVGSAPSFPAGAPESRSQDLRGSARSRPPYSSLPASGPISPGTGAANLFGSAFTSPQRQPESARSDSFFAREPAPSGDPGPMDSGGVTRMIQRLSEEVREFAKTETPETAPIAVPAQGNLVPGEYTRMTSITDLDSIARGQTAAPPPASSPAASIPGAPPLAKPAFAPLAMPAPAIAKPAVKLEAPKFEPPKPAPPAVAAPLNKFQEMVPFLLVINTFLLLVLIVLVIFQIRGR